MHWLTPVLASTSMSKGHPFVDSDEGDEFIVDRITIIEILVHFKELIGP